jgi:hypothetical protein
VQEKAVAVARVVAAKAAVVAGADKVTGEDGRAVLQEIHREVEGPMGRVGANNSAKTHRGGGNTAVSVFFTIHATRVA